MNQPTSEGEDGDDKHCTTEDNRLWVIMVPDVIVGELVKVRIFRNKKNYSEADLVEILEPSPDRVEPKCVLAGKCGGCQYQHMKIETQREWKTRHVNDLFAQHRIIGYEQKEQLNVRPTMGTPEIFGYRTKLTPHYNAPREISPNVFEYEAIGFQRSTNRTLVDVPECIIATDEINFKYRQVREELHANASVGIVRQRKKPKKKAGNSATGVTLLFRHADNDQVTGNPVVSTDHMEYVTTTVRGLKFRYLAGNFFQNNNHVLPLMVESVLEAAMAPTSTGERPSHLIDCYCGSGLFAISAASKFDLCVGIEVNPRAVEEATDNARLNNISNCQFVAASAEAIFTSPPKLTVENFEDEEVQDFPREKTVVVLDPPRKGCSEEFLMQLYDYSPERIIYMSCGPDSQARDSKGIVETGGYEIVSIQPFDLFPQTRHIECLVVFEKKKPAQ